MGKAIVNKGSYYFHHGWHFLLTDEFPLNKAIDKWRDESGCRFYETDYIENEWENVTLPHTFNDKDLFRDRISDGGSGQKRTTVFYRNWLTVPSERTGQKVFLEFEGMRQTCYLYVNGKMVGYYEAGVSPFGFDITSQIDYEKPNLIAIATDNTATRNIDFCIAETPNKPDVIPGSYLSEQDGKVDEAFKGVGFFWNCNDFNPSVGGITRPVKVHFKPNIYITLPLYSNLQTKGVYVYGKNYNTLHSMAKVTAESEIRNESGTEVTAFTEVSVKNIYGEEITCFKSEEKKLPPTPLFTPNLSITPQDAYTEECLPDGRKHYIPINNEQAVSATITESVNVSVLTAVSDMTSLRFWSIADPYLYRVEIRLFVNGILIDSTVVETGFRKVGYDNGRGILINDVPVWLRGYAQRASNEWAAIGIAPEWLRDIDAMMIKESNANHIRWMHVAGTKADIRAFDRHGIICTQPAGDKERENFGRQWDQRVELMRDIIIAFRNHPSILFWEAGNNSISKEHMREMRQLKEKLDLNGGRFMGCRTLNTDETVNESEYVGTMLNRHAAHFIAEHGPVMETEYLREEAPKRVWDDFSPPDFDYKCKSLSTT
ncbi:MAG: glycoside hydrolase family 2 TIM barrel-domain containing protein [bacterium]|nr:glycoside hydrolase family 2 TIM barrel-domain containing protein [bacterium]